MLETTSALSNLRDSDVCCFILLCSVYVYVCVLACMHTHVCVFCVYVECVHSIVQ